MMTARRAQIAGIATVLAVSLTGCGAGSVGAATTPTPDATTAAEPRDVLLDAVPDEKEGAYAYTVTGGETPISGVLDAPAKAIELKVTQPGDPFTLTMTTRAIGDRSWVKVAFSPAGLPGLPKIPKKWLLLDRAKVKDKDRGIIGYDGSIDPGSAYVLVKNGAGVKQTSAGHFTGTTDLTKTTDILDEKTIKALGGQAKTVPLTAVVDGQGHLTSLTLAIPAAGKTKAQTYAVRYSGFGTTATPAVPSAGEQQKAPAVVYEMLFS
jgi:hypothetical protein